MRAAAVLAAVLGVATVAGGLGGSARSAPNADPLREAILFVGGPGSLGPDGRRLGSGLYALDSGGGPLKELVRGEVVHARWSPDGRLLAFVRSPVGSPPELYVVGARGGTPRLLAQTGSFSWSPDSRQIAYSQEAGSAAAIFVVGVGGGRPRLLTSAGGAFLSWSPDGGKLAFVDHNGALYEIHADGSGQRPLAPGLNVSEPQLSWSPDGTRLAFNPCCDRGFAVVDADGSHLRMLVGRGTLLPAWSPDGRWIALTGSVDNSSGTFLVRPNGGGLHRISALGGTPFTAAWSPDSQALAVDDRCCSPDVWVISLNGGAPRRLTEGRRYGYGDAEPEWQPRSLPLAKLAGRLLSPANPTDSLVSGKVVRLREPVERLAADGRQVVYATASWCEGWRPPAASVVRINQCAASTWTFGPALTGGRLAWSSVSPAMQGDNWTVSTATVNVPRVDSVTFPAGTPFFGGAVFRDLAATALAGNGDLLVFSTWGPCPLFIYPDSPCGKQPKQNGILWRIDGEKAVEVASSTGALTPLAVDAGRILVDREDGALQLLRPDGSSPQTFQVGAGDLLGAKLQGPDVAVLTQTSIADYDAGSGALRHEWPLATGELQLDGLQDGLAVYVSGSDIHLLRLADGRDAVVHASGTGPVAAQLTASGLFYSYTVDDPRYPGRVAFVPFSNLPH